MVGQPTGVWHVLIVDDDQDDFLITRSMLREAQWSKIQLDWASTYEAGLEALRSDSYDAVLVDYNLGARSGIELIREITAWDCSIPLILYTGLGSYELDVEAMKAGATLYLTKSEANPLLLERFLRYAIERKRVEKALEAAKEQAIQEENRLEAIIQALPVGVWITDQKGQIVGKNKQADRIWAGDTPLVKDFTHYLEYQAWDVESGKRLDPEEYPLTRAVRTGQPIEPHEQHIRRFDGSEGIVLVSAEPIHDREGCLSGVVAINVDITERKEKEAEREILLAQLEGQQQVVERLASEAQKRADEWDAIFTALTEAVIVYNEAGKAVHVNPAAVKALGFDPTRSTIPSLLAKLSSRYPDGHLLTPAEAPPQRALSGETVNEEHYILTNLEGRSISIVSSASPLWDHGRVVGAVNVWRDVSEQERLLDEVQRRAAELEAGIAERKQMEEALRESEREYRELVQYAPAGIYVVDFRRKRFTSVNDAMCLLTGYSREELLQMSPLDILDEQSRRLFQDRMRQWLAGEKPETNVEYRVLAKDGHEIYAVLNVTFTKDEQGLPLGATVVGHDITERKRAEALLKEQSAAIQEYSNKLEQSNQALQDFAFIASHDLREPLRKVRIFSDRLARQARGRLTESELDYLERMQQAASRMQGMLDGLLDYSRVDAHGNAFEEVDLDRVARDVLSDLELRLKETGGSVELEDLPIVQADSLQMHQLFDNLTANALKFSRPGVPPFIKISSSFNSGHSLEITVEDNGIGFDRSAAGQLFKPFHRLVGHSEYEGSGMGLAICRKIAERHGGTISAEGNPGKGSKFTVTLPYTPKG